MPASPARLARYLVYAYAGLLAYATLYPLTGWRDLGVSPWGFLVFEWPRYWTVTDLVFNALAYLPLGFLLTNLLAARIRLAWSAVLAGFMAASLSLGLETLQNWLPGRDPSILDLASNSLGGFFGALLAFVWGDRLMRQLGRWLNRVLSPVPHVELGLLLLLLWLMCQLFPVAIPLGMGDVRYLIGLISPGGFDPNRFHGIATTIVAANVLAAGLLLSILMPSRLSAYLALPVLFGLSFMLRTAGQWWQSSPTGVDLTWLNKALAWLGPAMVDGSLLAFALLAMLLLLPGGVRAMLAGLALLVAAVLVNLAPGDPYSRLAGGNGLPSFFFNVQNLAHGLAALWPFLALPYLLFVSRRL